jgi:hypothetical protein
MNLVGVELEGRHCRMTGIDALGESLEGFRPVAQMQHSEWWRDLEGAWSHAIDEVAPCTIG